MHRKASLAALALGVLLVPTVALAAGGDGSFNGARVFRHLLNLVIFIGVVGYLVKTPLSDFLQFRRTEIKEGLDKAFDLKANAEDRFTDLQARIDGFETEVAAMMARVEEDGAREHERLIQAGHDAAKQIAAATERAIAEETRRAADELREEAIDLAMGQARSLLSGAVGADDQRRLADTYMSTLQEAARS